MPYVGSGNDLVNQLIQLSRIINDQKNRQADNLLTLAQPGQTAQEAGLTGKVGKRALGRDVNPTDIVKPDTADTLMDRKVKQFMSADPTTRQQLAADPSFNMPEVVSYFRTKYLGTPGATTATGLVTEMQGGEVAATNKLKALQATGQAIDSGIQAWHGASQITKGDLGSQLLFGTTPTALEAQHNSDELKGLISHQ